MPEVTARAPRKVSIAIPQLAGGGAEKMVANLAALLRDDGLLSRVYAGSAAGSETLEGIETVDLAAPSALAAATGFARALRHDPAGTYLLTLGYVNLAPILRLLRPRARIVLRIGNTLSPELATLGHLRRLRYMASLGFSLRFADSVIVQSDHMGQDLARHFPAVRPKLTTIHNFIEDGLWSYREPAERPLRPPYVFTAATFKPQKGHDVLLAAYARSAARENGIRLVVAGIAPEHPGFAALMAENGLSPDEVIRPGFVQPYRWIAHSELCVLASRYEGFSNFLLECAALGKRIVATDCPGGNAELFAHYRNAITVPTDEPDALALALGARRKDLARDEARKQLQAFEKNPVYARYRALLLPQVEATPEPRARPRQD